jgi:hypothetical protein
MMWSPLLISFLNAYNEYYPVKFQSLLEKVDLSQQKKAALEAELDNARESSREEVRLHRERITQLEQQLLQAEDLFLQQQEAQEENRQLALDLEREKGRLAGKFPHIIIVYMEIKTPLRR